METQLQPRPITPPRHLLFMITLTYDSLRKGSHTHHLYLYRFNPTLETQHGAGDVKSGASKAGYQTVPSAARLRG